MGAEAPTAPILTGALDGMSNRTQKCGKTCQICANYMFTAKLSGAKDKIMFLVLVKKNAQIDLKAKLVTHLSKAQSSNN